MASERTEKPTPKRQGDARKKGQVPKSADFDSAVMLSIGVILLYLFIPSVVDKLKQISIETFTHLDPSLLNRQSFIGFFSPYGSVLMSILLPFMIIILICGMILKYVQIGPLFSFEAIIPDLKKLSPAGMLQGFKRFVSLKSLIELVKSFIKMAVVGITAYSVIESRKDEIFRLIGADISQSLTVITSIIFDMLVKICIMLFFLGIADKKYQAYEYEKSLKMTKDEVKDERKNSEGDPKIKAKIKSIQMQFAMQRMMGNIPKADVIVTNPTHYAVAIRYDTSIAPAPQVVAKGVDYVAFKIRDVAKYNNIPIIENPPLARTLYKIVPLEGIIPAELYVAVAEILALVYKTNRGK